jgi:hypothetical protein
MSLIIALILIKSMVIVVFFSALLSVPVAPWTKLATYFEPVDDVVKANCPSEKRSGSVPKYDV